MNPLLHPNEERMAGWSRQFALPQSIVLIAMIAVGHPAEKPPARTRYRDDAVRSPHGASAGCLHAGPLANGLINFVGSFVG